PHGGRVDVRLHAAGPGIGEEAIETTEHRLRARLGPALYGVGERPLEAVVLERLGERGLTLGVAESLTGGRIGAALTRVPGSSAVFLGDIVAYSNEAKQTLLNVPADLLVAHGAVSAHTARAMAVGARQALGAGVAISTTGIAGPAGGTDRKPVGLVFCGLATPHSTMSYRFHFAGSREMIQDRSVTLALNVLWLYLLQRLDRLAAHVPSGEPEDAHD
ncbi:MAG: nicotinamide-nucleotide amidohydrolase family protein, partial [Candidatus Eisenbacteria bacterium]